MPRYAPKMSPNDLRELVFALALTNDYEEDYDTLDRNAPDMDRLLHHLFSEDLLPAVVKDWAKVTFDYENISVEAEKTTPDGIPYIEMAIGGDWETPVLAIIYHDGKTFRGFVPKKGNTYNHQTKSAFGNNDSDSDAAYKQFGVPPTPDGNWYNLEPDHALTTAEIHGRLEAKGTFVPPSTAIVSNATVKKQRQAAIEQTLDLSGPITPSMVYAVIELAAGCSYVSFELRASRRALSYAESERLVGVPARLEKSKPTSYNTTPVWYTPDGCYPLHAQKLLETAGFEKAPDNDISMYADARTVIVLL